jgi:hypothetical protein
MEAILTIVSKIARETKTVPLYRWRSGEKETVFLYELKGANDPVLLSDTITRLEVTVRP